MRPLVVFEHGPTTPPGWLGEVLNARGIDHQLVRLHAGEPIPDHADWAGIVSLGGVMGAYDEESYPFLRAEKALLRAAIQQGVPVLGLCLGCQLLAEALGGQVYRGARPELGYIDLQLTPAGQQDRIVGAMARPVLSYHQDTWTLPPGGHLLAESAAYPQAFRLGTGLGVQFHPEATPNILTQWVGNSAHLLRAAGVDGEALLAEAARVAGPARAEAERLFGAWLDGLPGLTD